uniref:Nucleolar protein 4-like b n=1 Tax=Sparus aurata TaxID=8175 RepID=A0A671Z1K2_SPAAU
SRGGRGGAEMFGEFQDWCLRTYGDSGKTKTVTRRKYNKILQTLLQGDEENSHGVFLHEKGNNHINAKFKFWVKSKGFQVGTLQDAKNGCVDSVSGVDSSLKRVAVVEDFFDIIYAMHVEISTDPGKAPKHAGQKKTYKAIAETYAFLPREAVTRFLMSCGECQKRMHISTAGQDCKGTKHNTAAHVRVRVRVWPEDSSSESGSGNGLPALTPPSSAVTDGAIVREAEVINGNGGPAPLDFSTPTSSSSSSEDQQPMNLSDPPPQRLPLSTSHLPVTVSAAAAALLDCVCVCVCVQSPQYSSGGSYDSVKMDISAEDLTMGRHGSQVAPDDDDDDHDDHDDNDKINDTEGVDPERLKAFNMFVRLFVDENLDRMVPISKQPKEKIQAIIESCSRQFPEFQERARKRIRTYLKSCRRMKKNGMETRPTPPHLTSAMAENILAAACENESRNAAKRMRLEAYHVSLQTLGGGGLREPASLAHSAYSLAASAFSSQDNQLYINGAGLSYAYRGYPGLGAAMQHPVSLTTGAAAQSNGPTDLSMKSLTSANISNSSLSQPEITAVRQLIAGYRESAAFLLRSADELENLILQQN